MTAPTPNPTLGEEGDGGGELIVVIFGSAKNFGDNIAVVQSIVCHVEQSEPLGRRPKASALDVKPKGLKSRISQGMWRSSNARYFVSLSMTRDVRVNCYIIAYFYMHMLYENSWQLWHCGRMFAFSLKKKGGAIARNGAFHYLYRVLPIGRAIAMACVNLRAGALVPLRWFVSVIAKV